MTRDQGPLQDGTVWVSQALGLSAPTSSGSFSLRSTFTLFFWVLVSMVPVTPVYEGGLPQTTAGPGLLHHLSGPVVSTCHDLGQLWPTQPVLPWTAWSGRTLGMGFQPVKVRVSVDTHSKHMAARLQDVTRQALVFSGFSDDKL